MKWSGLGVANSVLESFRLLERRDRRRIVSLTLGRVLAQFLDVAGLAAVGVLAAYLAQSLDGRGPTTLFGIQMGEITREALLTYSIAVTLLFLLKSFFSALLVRATAMFLARVEAATSMEVLRFIFGSSLSRLRSMSRGEIQWAVGASTYHAFSGLLYSATTIIAETSLFLAVFVVMFVTDWVSAISVAAYFALILISFQLVINKQLREIGERLEKNSAEAGNSILDFLGTFKEISVLHKKEFFYENFRVYRAGQASDQATHKFLLSLPRYFVEAALIIGVVFLLGWQLTNSDFESGLLTVSVFLAGGVRMMAALLPIQNAFAMIKTLAPQASRAQRLLKDARAEFCGFDQDLRNIDSTNLRQAVSDHRRVLEFNDVSFSYDGDNTPSLNKINLEVKAGEFVAIAGPSGAGKTTLADLALGLHSPSSGRALLFGLPAVNLNLLRPGVVGYVPQRPGVVGGSIAENVALGEDRAEIRESDVYEALEAAQLLSIVRDRPGGIWADLGRQNDALSGGQIQRLGVARALYLRPEFLILDEATSALDAETEASITDFIEQLKPKVAVLVIAHRLSTIRKADRIYLLEKGTIQACGTFRELEASQENFRRSIQLMNLS